MGSRLSSDGGRSPREQPRVDLEPFVVVDVQQPADRAQQRRLGRSCRRGGQTRRRGAAPTSCDRRRRRPRARGHCSRGTRRARRRRASGAPRTARATCSGSRRGCCRARSPCATGRAGSCSRPAGTGSPCRTCRSTSAREPPSSARSRRSKRNSLRCVPTKSRTVHALLPGGLPEPAPQLLEEQRRAFGRTQQQQRVDGRDVDALVEEVDGEDDAHAAVGEVAQRRPPLVRTARRRERDGRQAELGEALGHELRVADADAVAERPHRRRDRRPCAGPPRPPDAPTRGPR